MREHGTEGKQYEQPMFRRVPRFDFTPKVVDKDGEAVTCRSCSACHGCR